jgi:hypothetical protein
MSSCTDLAGQNTHLAALRRIAKTQSGPSLPTSMVCDLIVPCIFSAINAIYVNEPAASRTDIPPDVVAENASHLASLLSIFSNQDDSHGNMSSFCRFLIRSLEKLPEISNRSV